MSSFNPNHQDALEFPRPAKYQTVALSPYWYSSAHKAAIEKKRKHTKRQGRLDLKTLSQTISACWRSADPMVVEYCRKLARAELEKYETIIEGTILKRNNKNKAAAAAKQASPSKCIRQHAWEPIHNRVLPLQNFGPGLTEEPIVTPPSMLKDNFNKAMVDSFEFLKMLQLRQEVQLANEKLERFCNSSQAPPFSGSQKRKSARRAAAPSSGNNNNITSSMGNINMMSFMGSCNSKNVFLGEDNCNVASIASQEPGSSMFPMMSNSDAVFNMGETINHKPQIRLQKRRASLVSMASGEHELSDSFHRELNNARPFSCVPEWEKEDADTLLNILNGLQVDGPVASFDLPLAADTNQDMTNMSMELDQLEEWDTCFGSCDIEGMFGICK